MRKRSSRCVHGYSIAHYAPSEPIVLVNVQLEQVVNTYHHAIQRRERLVPKYTILGHDSVASETYHPPAVLIDSAVQTRLKTILRVVVFFRTCYSSGMVAKKEILGAKGAQFRVPKIRAGGKVVTSSMSRCYAASFNKVERKLPLFCKLSNVSKSLKLGVYASPF